ncbi:regulatory protein, FmdB family [Isosphaera pallida ATCC 43644]|uniref:Regulatory protein, FmdB family n=1 Tax=Isosphaera pallida (strain ATCC 43644 / DSM 9630 / IS1B) TaxID=575540 RepID=E8QZL8_ISOPI|nr:FmdB family zinc ribbon protein [Isosphaera pallida]ADV62154.1 regulatory protein, FmdB family [Isosphaera pallida ATCC 43644]
MPTYEYVCEACGYEFDAFESIKAEPQTVCPACGAPKLRRKLGTGAAILFKGSGFYITDYRSESYRKGAEADKSSALGGSTVKESSNGSASRSSNGSASPSSKGTLVSSAASAKTSS